MIPWSIAIIDDSEKSKVKEAIKHAYREIEVFKDEDGLLEMLDGAYYCDVVIINPINTVRVLDLETAIQKIVSKSPYIDIIIIGDKETLEEIEQLGDKSKIHIKQLSEDFHSQVQKILQS